MTEKEKIVKQTVIKTLRTVAWDFIRYVLDYPGEEEGVAGESKRLSKEKRWEVAAFQEKGLPVICNSWNTVMLMGGLGVEQDLQVIMYQKNSSSSESILFGIY